MSTIFDNFKSVIKDKNNDYNIKVLTGSSIKIVKEWCIVDLNGKGATYYVVEDYLITEKKFKFMTGTDLRIRKSRIDELVIDKKLRRKIIQAVIRYELSVTNKQS